MNKVVDLGITALIGIRPKQDPASDVSGNTAVCALNR
ncbi:hypothetical protein ACV242_004534 [Peribacillus simplex]